MSCRRVSILLVLALTTAACGGSSGGEAPALPPEDSMTVDFKSLDNGGALVDPTARSHWANAALRVGILNLWVGLGLAPHVAVFRAAHSQTAQEEGDAWVWRYTVKNATVDATASLSARLDGKASIWQMRINGKVGAEQFTDFLWYEGRYEVSSGDWQIYDKAGKLVRIDWTVTAPTEKELRFTNNAGGDDDGNFLVYRRAADAATVSYDFQENRKADIAWSVSTRAGSLVAADFAGHENQKACWSASLFDAECP